MKTRQIDVTVLNKIATADPNALYVCGNSDYTVVFDFDEGWEEYDSKTARFSYDGAYIDVVFQGNVCPVPVLSNVYWFKVGVFAGNLRTTTPAYVAATKSILCEGGSPAAPADDVYNQLMALINDLTKDDATNEAIAAAVADYLRKNPVEIVETDPTVPAWAKEPEKPTYTAEEVGAQPKGDYALKSDIPAIPDIPAPYDLPTASATVKGGVKVGSGLQMDGDVLGVKPKKFELIESVTMTESATLERTQEPDGTPYKFDGAVVHILIPKGIEAPSGSVLFFKTNNHNTHFIHRWLAAKTRDAMQAWEGKVVNNHGMYDYVLPGTWDIDGGSPDFLAAVKTYDGHFAANYPIGKISITMVLPVGSIVTIRGLRSNA